MLGIVAPEQVAGLPLWPVLVVIGLMVAMNVVNNRLAPDTHFLIWAVTGSALLIAVGLLDGNSFTDMGLSWHYAVPGLLWGFICIAAVTLVYLVGAAFKKTRDAFHDERHQQMSGAQLAFHALLEVPFGTVLLEEIAFRAVLFSMLARRYGVVWGLVISSLLFGLWHILPSIGTHESNPALGSVAGSGLRGNIVAVTMSVLFTAISGVLFTGLRLVSGSVLAPMGLHWATNGLGYAFSFALIRGRRRAEARAQDREARRAGEEPR